MENVPTLSASQEKPTSLPKSGTIMEPMPTTSQPNIDYCVKEEPTMPLPSTSTIMEEKWTPSTSSVAKEKPTSQPSTSTTDIMEKMPTLTNLTHLEAKDGKNFVKIIERIGSDYEDLGILLLQDDYGSVMGTLKHDALKANECTREIFRIWLNQCGDHKSCTWKVLIKILFKIKQNTLAEDITEVLKTYQTNHTEHVD